MPKVSVIIPNYNHAPYLKQRIDSVLFQTYEDFEVVILDDNSQDNSREIIETYRTHPKVKSIHFNTTNSGSTFRQWQKGIELSSGEFLWIAESDDWSAQEFLAVLVEAASRHPMVGICFSGSNWIDQNGHSGKDLSLYNQSFFRLGIDEIKMSMIRHCTIQNASSMIIRRQIAERFIGNVLNYKACGDWHLYLDVLMETNLVFVSQKLNNFRWYHNNISNNANKTGIWISEGLKAIAQSSVYKASFRRWELVEVFRYWFAKTKGFKSFKKFHLQVLTVIYFSIFAIRNALYNLNHRVRL